MARPRAVSSLQNWNFGTACVARKEAAYLGLFENLLSIASSNDAVTAWLETIVKRFLIWLQQTFGLEKRPSQSEEGFLLTRCRTKNSEL